jgi:hypothetical protein
MFIGLVSICACSTAFSLSTIVVSDLCVFVVFTRMFCQYRDVFGQPREGAHSYRLLDVAVVDVLLTVMVGYVLSRILRKPPALVIGVLFVAGVALHRLFCVRTTLDRLLFPDRRT